MLTEEDEPGRPEAFDPRKPKNKNDIMRKIISILGFISGLSLVSLFFYPGGPRCLRGDEWIGPAIVQAQEKHPVAKAQAQGKHTAAQTQGKHPAAQAQTKRSAAQTRKKNNSAQARKKAHQAEIQKKILIPSPTPTPKPTSPPAQEDEDTMREPVDLSDGTEPSPEPARTTRTEQKRPVTPTPTATPTPTPTPTPAYSLTPKEKLAKDNREKEEKIAERETRMQQVKADIKVLLDKLAEVQKRIDELAAKKKEIQEVKKPKEGPHNDETLVRLAKIYEQTPPELAGPLLSDLDPTLAAQLIMLMNVRKAGQVWGFIDKAKVGKISEEIAHKKSDAQKAEKK
ncbi:MAG: hypothetical protein HQK60_10130 [Deltaproteobacteria bacterium]|nr:hypothetical protein [Deltaproteobacteria bacterium]